MNSTARPDPTRASGAISPAARTRIIQLLLVLVTAVVYFQVAWHSFVDYDDPAYVTANRHVRNGLSREGIDWAFTRLAGEDTYWHPVTWLSHMLDCQLFGINAGAQHLVNVAFHIANVLLLFSILQELTAAQYRSAVVAALFALHPLQVDTVAWIAERKNLLSVLFCLLSIQAYIRYVRASKDSLKSKAIPFAANLVFFALGLMAKPSVVILPFVLLLLDFWPLRRYIQVPATQPAWLPIIMEKLPMFALSVASSIVTILSHNRLGLIASGDELPFLHRVANAVVSYCRYLGKVVWPSNLAVYYPYLSTLPVAVFTAAALVLVAITALCVLMARKRPYLIVGWLWFLGALVPAIGIVQASSQAMADRFVYFPIIGLAIMVVWGGYDFLNALRLPHAAVVSMAAVAIFVCSVLSAHQCRYWQNSLTLFGHAVAATHDNYLAHVNYGTALKARGFNAAAKTNFLEALKLKPSSPEALNGLGVISFEEGDAPGAMSNFVAALKIKPNYAEAHNNLGNALALRGDHAAASVEFVTAFSLNPNYAEAHNNLGRVREIEGRLVEAVTEYRRALTVDPDYTGARLNLVRILLSQENLTEAARELMTLQSRNPNLNQTHYLVAQLLVRQNNAAEALNEFAIALDKKPTSADAISALAMALIADNKIPAAIDYLQQGIRANPVNPDVHVNLGNAFAMEGKLDDAAHEYRSALDLKPDFAEAHFNLANILNTQEKTAEAVAQYQEALRLKPDYCDAHLNLARILSQQGRFDDAAEHFSAALELNANDAQAHFDFGLLLERQGKRALAENQFAEALRLNPEFTEAKTRLSGNSSVSPK